MGQTDPSKSGMELPSLFCNIDTRSLCFKGENGIFQGHFACKMTHVDLQRNLTHFAT